MVNDINVTRIPGGVFDNFVDDAINGDPNLAHGVVHPKHGFPVFEVIDELFQKNVEVEDLVEGLVRALEVGDDALQRPGDFVVPGIVESLG